MSQVPSVGSGATEASKRGSKDLRDVDLNQFLQLLVTEIQNQDPLDPMDNSEILQQISQIREISATNMLNDTLTAISTGQNISTASSLIGKQVKALSDEGKDVQGTVDRVSVAEKDDGQRTVRVHIGSESVSLKNIRDIVMPE